MDIFDVESLFPELVVGLGLALLLGNGLAWWKNRKGQAPKGLEDAAFRPGRAFFLMTVGLVMTAWGLATLLR